jgi:hypothetical protein
MWKTNYAIYFTIDLIKFGALHIIERSCDSTVGIATSYRLDS